MRDQFPFAVARVTRRWRKMLDERLKDLGVTQARWSTMVYLEKGGEGLTQRETGQPHGDRESDPWFVCLIAWSNKV